MKAVSPVIPGENHQEIKVAENQPQYETLPCIPVNNGQDMIARFKLSESEIEEITRTKSVWVVLKTFGNQIQPFFITTAKPNITYPKAKEFFYGKDKRIVRPPKY